MKNDTTRDILIELRTDVKYIKKSLENNTKELKSHCKRIGTVEDWQDGWSVRMKMMAGIASFIGGIIVFIADKIWEVLSIKI